MNSIRCSNCSLLNFDTATSCKRCGLPFNSEVEAGDDAQQYAPAESYPPPPAEGNSYFWDQPNYQPNYFPPPLPPSSSSSSGRKVLGVAVLLALLSLVSFVAIPKILKPRKANLSNLSWSDYKSSDGSFSVTLPTASPKETRVSQPTPVGNIQVNMVLAEIDRDSACMVMYADYPMMGKVSEEMLYEQTLKSMESADAQQLAPSSRKFITQDGHRGIEAEFKPAMLKRIDAKARARMFWVAPRLYLVMSGGPETPEFDTVSNRCLDSFKFSTGR